MMLIALIFGLVLGALAYSTPALLRVIFWLRNEQYFPPEEWSKLMDEEFARADEHFRRAMDELDHVMGLRRISYKDRTQPDPPLPL